MLMNDLFHQMGMILKQLGDYTEYVLDSFAVPICIKLPTSVSMLKLYLLAQIISFENWQFQLLKFVALRYTHC